MRAIEFSSIVWNTIYPYFGFVFLYLPSLSLIEHFLICSNYFHFLSFERFDIQVALVWLNVGLGFLRFVTGLLIIDSNWVLRSLLPININLDEYFLCFRLWLLTSGRLYAPKRRTIERRLNIYSFFFCSRLLLWVAARDVYHWLIQSLIKFKLDSWGSSVIVRFFWNLRADLLRSRAIVLNRVFLIFVNVLWAWVLLKSSRIFLLDVLLKLFPLIRVDMQGRLLVVSLSMRRVRSAVRISWGSVSTTSVFIIQCILQERQSYIIEFIILCLKKLLLLFQAVHLQFLDVIFLTYWSLPLLYWSPFACKNILSFIWAWCYYTKLLVLNWYWFSIYTGQWSDFILLFFCHQGCRISMLSEGWAVF